MFYYHPLPKTRLSFGGFLVSPCLPKTPFLRMHRNAPTTLGGRTRTAKRTLRTSRTERKGLDTFGRSPKGRRCLSARTRHLVVGKVNYEVTLDKQTVSTDFLGHLGQQLPVGLGKRGAGRSAAVSAVARRFDHREPGVRFGLLYKRKRAAGIACEDGEDGEGHDELAVLVNGDIGFVSVEALGSALPAVANVGIRRRRHPALGRAFLDMRLFAAVGLWDGDIVQKQLLQQQSRLAHLGPGGSGKPQQMLGVRDDLGEESVLGRVVRPVEISAAFDTVFCVAVEVVIGKEIVGFLSLLLRKNAAQLPYPARQEIESVLYGSAAPDGLGVESDFERLAFKKAASLGFLEAGLKQGVDLGMQDKVGTEELEGTFSAQGLSRFAAQNGTPAQVVGGAVDGFFVRDIGLVLQEGNEGEEGRRDAGAAMLVFIEDGEIVVFKEAGRGESELGMETLGVEFEVEDVSDIEQGVLGGSFTEHSNSLLGLISSDGKVRHRLREFLWCLTKLCRLFGYASSFALCTKVKRITIMPLRR